MGVPSYKPPNIDKPKSIMKKWMIVMIAGLCAAALSGCDKNDPVAEPATTQDAASVSETVKDDVVDAGQAVKRETVEAGQAVKSGVEKTGDAIEAGVEKAGDAIKTGAEKTKDGAEALGKEIEKKAEDVTGN